MFNNEGECGTGAVVPWADRLWVVSYGPHLPFGSSDKLYEITPDLRQIVRPESIGGTPADRMIHRESGQLIIGPYFIDAQRNVRVVPWQKMPGRLTGVARHLTDPANKVYVATMEAGLYEVDVHSLVVTGLLKERMNKPKPGQTSEAHPATLETKLPGWHGKGLFSGQGRLVFSNNGEHGKAAETNPDTESGALGEWTGAGDFQLVRRNQFVEVTGPGGIYGNAQPDTDPVWATGWDKRSVIVLCLDGGKWLTYRLPKASHTYDGGHGWHTEWPRIRDIGERDLLMTMHGTLWNFPKTFSARNSAGIAPRSTHLCVTGDFCRWNDRVVFGCDVTAKSEFLNARKAKGKVLSPGQSQSNLWFVEPRRLDELGPPIGQGAVWLADKVAARAPSDPILFSGFAQRALWLQHDEPEPVTFTLEVDARGDGQWAQLREVPVAARSGAQLNFKADEQGIWLRVTASRDCASATALLHYRNEDKRGASATDIFDGVAKPVDKNVSGGLLRARGDNLRTLAFATADAYYELDGELNLVRRNDAPAEAYLRKNMAIPDGVLTYDAASVLYTDEKGRRWRLPKGDVAFDAPGVLGAERVDREVVTERDLFNCGGIFYELPAESSGGFGKIRPVTTHNRRIKDYATYRGLLLLSGVTDDAKGTHIIRSDDGKAALWAGAVDDLWQFGKPRGDGGPWKLTPVQAGTPSDPYLMWGFDQRTLKLSHQHPQPVIIEIEVDPLGTGKWVPHQRVTAPPGEAGATVVFDPLLPAHWLRLTANVNCTATASLSYR
ncbi:MAG: hypothetical protein EBS05_07460 [Proteobacteria bacterium]|nr:hypothetical protein [Pseudomonadota bacterium]